jgi:hypothetical protein
MIETGPLPSVFKTVLVQQSADLSKYSLVPAPPDLAVRAKRLRFVVRKYPEIDIVTHAAS